MLFSAHVFGSSQLVGSCSLLTSLVWMGQLIAFLKTSSQNCVGPLSPHIHCNVESQLPAKAALVNSKSSSSSSWIKIHGNVRTWSVKNNEWLHTMLDYFNQGCRVFTLSYIFIIYLSRQRKFQPNCQTSDNKVSRLATKTNILQRQKKIYTFFGQFYYNTFFLYNAQ